MYKITLPNGTQVEVSQETYNKILEENNPKMYYNSSSKGLIKISDMADEHLRNAMLKLTREAVLKELNRLKTQPLGIVSQTLRRQINVPNLEPLQQEAEKRRLFPHFPLLPRLPKW